MGGEVMRSPPAHQHHQVQRERAQRLRGQEQGWSYSLRTGGGTEATGKEAGGSPGRSEKGKCAEAGEARLA